MRIRRPSLRAALTSVVALACAATLLIMAGLSIQMAVGRDPALEPPLAAKQKRGAASAAPSAATPPSPGAVDPAAATPAPAPVITSTS